MELPDKIDKIPVSQKSSQILKKAFVERILPILNKNIGETHETYSAEIRHTYTVNTNGMFNETKHFSVWNTLNKSYCPHRKTFG